MTSRRLPEIRAFEPPAALDWDVPASAQERWSPVRAATENDRTLAITEEIGERWDGSGVTVKYVRGFLRRVESGPITVNINSTGGDFFVGLAIYNMLREYDGEVTTNVLGIAASAASLIAMASDKLRVAKAGFLMIHNAWAIALGNRNDMRATADLLEQFDGAMASVYADRSGIPAAKVAEYMDAESFFNGENAVKLGLADALLASDEVQPEDESPAKAALRRVDLELAKAGVPRTERRRLMHELPGGAAARDRGTPGATPHATPGAGDLAALLRSSVDLLTFP